MMRLDDNLFIMFREEWDKSGRPRLGGPPQPGKRFIHPHERLGIIEHHTVTVDNDATKNVWEWVDEEIKPHMERLRTIRAGDLGEDVPYSWCKFCMPGGKLVVCEGRGNMRSGAHTYPYDGYPYNTKYMGNVWVGNFEDYAININPWLPANNRFNGWLKYDIGMENLGPIQYHGGIPGASTACPGTFIKRKLSKMGYTEPEREEDDMAALMVMIYHQDRGEYSITDWKDRRPLAGQSELDLFRYLGISEAKLPKKSYENIPLTATDHDH